jgi:hypothetical protein
LVRALFGRLQISGTGRMSTGQPFTVNSIFDVNLDGNLTDRLNTTNGLVSTGSAQQPLLLTADPATLLAPIGADGAIARNTFRAGGVVQLDLAASRRIHLSGAHTLLLRCEIFNLTNRANFGVPVRYLEAPAFGRATRTITQGRRVQFSLKYEF